MKRLVLPLLLMLTLLSCSDRRDDGTRRSMYYWSTVLDMDSAKADFIDRHGIGRIYLRYFDVVKDETGALTPNATLAFKTGVPHGVETVPTVYITNDCMLGDVGGLAEKICLRIKQMSRTNDIDGVKEIQMDCDWTRLTRKRYFRFLEELRALAHADGLTLSVTIRLHQLSQPAPPADRGVLMMYNTGDFTDLTCEKPILDMRDAAPYMHRLHSYRLHLSSAYPLFGWRILFRRGRYVGIMHKDDDLPVLPGDSIVVRQPSLEDIMTAVKAVGRKRPDANREVILYDLSNPNISKFNPDDYEKIFNH